MKTRSFLASLACTLIPASWAAQPKPAVPPAGGRVREYNVKVGLSRTVDTSEPHESSAQALRDLMAKVPEDHVILDIQWQNILDSVHNPLGTKGRWRVTILPHFADSYRREVLGRIRNPGAPWREPDRLEIRSA